MSWRVALVALSVLTGVLAASPSRADSVRYLLTAESRLTTYCAACDPTTTRTEPLRGAFDLSVLPGVDYAVEAVTGVHWETDTVKIAGSGFIQRLGDVGLTMVLDSRLNGVPILLTSGRRQHVPPGEIRLHLTSPHGGQSGFTVALVAIPVPPSSPDADGDGVVDAADSCPATANANQSDADGDGIGDACDRCPDTAADTPVLGDGCSIEQSCPCQGPSTGEEWADQGSYVQCVARTLRQLRLRGQIEKNEIRKLLQGAVRSSCGRRILAMG